MLTSLSGPTVTKLSCGCAVAVRASAAASDRTAAVSDRTAAVDDPAVFNGPVEFNDPVESNDPAESNDPVEFNGPVEFNAVRLTLVDTRVTFPAGELTAEAEVLAVVPLADGYPAGAVGVVTDVTPFHPIDHGWPDQGADAGTIGPVGPEPAVAVLDVVVGATQGTNLLSAANIPVRRGEPGWAFLVVHVLSGDSWIPRPGERVRLRVEAALRRGLSFGHSGCHLSALALNAALAGTWRKEVELDGLGHPHFDRLASNTSRIGPFSSVDTYRLGKSLRKKGFDADRLDLDAVARDANDHLARWLSTGIESRLEVSGPGLTDRRTWVARVVDGTVGIACGGTHPSSLAEVGAIEVELGRQEAELTMETKVTLH